MAETTDPRHQKFLRNLAASKPAVEAGAAWLRSKGFTPRVADLSMAPEHRDWKKHADSGDIYIVVDGIERRVEVKRLKPDFQGRKTWPFGNKFIVCAQHAWDNATPKPYGFIIMNQSMTVAAIVKGDSCGHWNVEPRRDSRYSDKTEYRQDFYLCPMEHVRFISLAPKEQAAA